MWLKESEMKLVGEYCSIIRDVSTGSVSSFERI